MKKELTLQELQPLIIEWANNKGLCKEENAPKQRLKLVEECGELASAILKGNVELKKDAIGDIFVVLIILAEQIEISLDFEFTQKSVESVNFFLNSVLNYSDNHCGNNYFCLQYLKGLSDSLNLDLTECANIAWNEIKDRTGKTVDGTFIKD